MNLLDERRRGGEERERGRERGRERNGRTRGPLREETTHDERSGRERIQVRT